MLRIINRKEFKGLTPIATIIDNRFSNDFFGENFFRKGEWFEYWENQIINFKFHSLYNVITIYSGQFTSLFKKEDLEVFFKLVVNPENLLEFLDKEVTLEIKRSIPKDSEEITKIWKYDFDKYFYTLGNESFFEEYHEILLNNTKIIKCLPYSWGCGFKLYCPDKLDLDDKLYWFNLCLLKLYATNWYKRSNKKCE